MNDLAIERSGVNLSSIIHIQPNVIRSIQISSDLENLNIAHNYVLTPHGRSCLRRMLLSINDHQYGRSWTLTGPYGSGKSFFSLFLMHLTSSFHAGNHMAIDQLSSLDPILAKQIVSELKLKETKGFFPVAVTGHRASFQECLKQGFQQAINQFGENSSLESLVNNLDNWSEETNSRVIIDWIRSFKSIVTNPENNFHGILLIFDELGKPLEYTASHFESADVYLLQELAEFANRSGDKPMVFIGILHQAFDRYATSLDQTTRREWAKVQGRFEDISYQEPYSQQTRLFSRAIGRVQNDLDDNLFLRTESIVTDAITAGWCPTMMNSDEFLEVCQASYPFHPSSLVVLPYIFKRLAQNERSIFAYLSSFEPFGFQEFIRTHSTPQFLRLPDLFDYLVANFQSRLYVSNKARALTETLERLNSALDLTSLQIEIIKTIGLLSWLAEVSTIQPTENYLISALITDQIIETDIRKAIDELKQKSVIVFRRHNRTFAVWQGSDVDIEERMEQAQRQVSGAFSIAEAVQQMLPPRPVVARRHSFQTGSLRFFEVRYVDVGSITTELINSKQRADGIIYLCLAGSQAEISEFIQWAKQPFLSNADGCLIGISKRAAHINELLFDLRCYHWIEENTPELRDDKVAQKELFTRINSIETLIQHELNQSINLHHLKDASECLWLYKGEELEIPPGDGISQVLSRICDVCYSASPRIWNELINRRSLSSQSAAARRNLIEGILSKPNQPILGITGYPPERSMYESLMLKGGLHRQITINQWEFVKPGEDDPLNLLPAWTAIYDFIFTNPPELRPITDLYIQLREKPYGVTDGVLPVLFCTFLQVHQEETTLYREGTLLAEPNVPDWEVLLRRPDLFSVAGCRVIGTRAAIIERIARGFRTSPTVMPIVRELIRQLKSLPDYAWRTNRISNEAIELRKSVDNVHSPEQLLFNDLPAALGLEPIHDDQFNPVVLDEFFNLLNQTLSDMAMATPRLREWARDTFLLECELPSGMEGWGAFVEITQEMNGRVSHPNLIPLIKRSAEASDPSAALDSVLALIANRPLQKWNDSDADRFPMLAQSIGRLFIAERNGYLPGLTLTQDEKSRSEAVMATLQGQLDQMNEDPRVLQAALQRLIDKYKSDTSSSNP